MPQDGLASQLPSELLDEVLKKADVPTLLKIKGVSHGFVFRVIPRRLPTRPLVAPHTHIPHRTPRLVRLSPQHTPSPSVRGPALSQCEWLA